MHLDQNPNQTRTRFACVGFYACGFSVPQVRQFRLFTYPSRSKWASSEKTIFFAKICTFCKSIAGPLSEATNYLSNHETWVIIHEISSSWRKKHQMAIIYIFHNNISIRRYFLAFVSVLSSISRCSLLGSMLARSRSNLNSENFAKWSQLTATKLCYYVKKTGLILLRF